MARLASGRRLGRLVEPILAGAKRRVWVATPFISREYAELLASKARAGASVRLVTSDAPENRESLRALRRAALGGRARRLAALALAALGAAVAVASWRAAPLAAALPLAGLAVLHRLLPAVALAVAGAACAAAYKLGLGPGVAGAGLCVYAVGAVLVVVAVRRGVGGGPRVKVVPRDRFLVHSKIIIADDRAIVGSANLTKTALWRNHETVTIYEPGEEGEAVEAFEELWRKA
ncbi:MAG: phospholipase D-like domain-containing protein [Desulfurococcales archaeon]|nr:phospholipase D-like domain-containing protein [Desulfurococcales archaeon]